MTAGAKMAFAAVLSMLALLGASVGVNVHAAYLRNSTMGAERFGNAAGFFLPAGVGWQSRELSLGQTESGSAYAIKVLNCTDFVYREFRKPGLVFDVYVAHWLRSQTPTSMVAAHTPDICWKGAGFRCVAEESGRPAYGFGSTTIGGEWRIFEDAGKVQRHVWYVHLGDGVYRGNGRAFDSLARPFERAIGLWRELRAGSPEQVFVRISSIVSFEQLAEEPFFRAFVANIDRLARADRTDRFKKREMRE